MRERAGKRDRLGRGLGALLGEYLGDQDLDGGTARSIPVAEIVPNPFQPRREFSEEELADLVASIRESGLLQPIVVRASKGGTGWELVAGERRWRAVMRLGWREVPALVREVDDRTMLVLALVENIQRSALSVLEEAAGYQQLATEFGMTQQQIADAVGRDRSTIANAMRLLQLPATVRNLLAEGRLSAGHARALLGLGHEQRIIEVAKRAAAEDWSVRQVEEMVQRSRPARSRRAAPGRRRDPSERLLEQELARALGTDVRIRRQGAARGRIEIAFYNAEDFERLFELLAGKPAVEAVS